MKGLEGEEQWREGGRGNRKECVTFSFKTGHPTRLSAGTQAVETYR